MRRHATIRTEGRVPVGLKQPTCAKSRWSPPTSAKIDRRPGAARRRLPRLGGYPGTLRQRRRLNSEQPRSTGLTATGPGQMALPKAATDGRGTTSAARLAHLETPGFDLLRVHTRDAGSTCHRGVGEAEGRQVTSARCHHGWLWGLRQAASGQEGRLAPHVRVALGLCLMRRRTVLNESETTGVTSENNPSLPRLVFLNTRSKA